jgi:hypothetical protein
MCKAGIAQDMGFAEGRKLSTSLWKKLIEGGLFVEQGSISRETGVATEGVFACGCDPRGQRWILAEQIGVGGWADDKAADVGSGLSDVVSGEANAVDQDCVGANTAQRFQAGILRGGDRISSFGEVDEPGLTRGCGLVGADHL